MKTMFIEAKSSADLKLPAKYLKDLPKKLVLATTAQHVHKIAELKTQLEKAGKKVSLIKGKHSKYAGQVLGCDAPKVKDAVLFVGTGGFHATGFDSDVFQFNPLSKKFYKQENRSGRRKAALAKFYSSDNIGVLISLKPGQLNLKKPIELKKKYRQKKFYFLLFDSLGINELENFPFIDCFVNSACPRIADDLGVINIKEIK